MGVIRNDPREFVLGLILSGLLLCVLSMLLIMNLHQYHYLIRISEKLRSQQFSIESSSLLPLYLKHTSSLSSTFNYTRQIWPPPERPKKTKKDRGSAVSGAVEVHIILHPPCEFLIPSANFEPLLSI